MKNKELQGLRGVSVILVIIFHLRPKSYRLGFIGVDIFFVLSGYFMSVILSKRRISIGQMRAFYSRRFRRIVPFFYFILIMVYAVCAVLTILPDRKTLVADLIWALTFTSNIQPLFEAKGYWNQISANRFLLHSWSLGVELQFYFFAPFLLGGALVHYRKKRVASLVVFCLLSLATHLFSPAKVSFGLLPSRVWQFVFGSLTNEFAVIRERYPILAFVEEGHIPLLDGNKDSDGYGELGGEIAVDASKRLPFTVQGALVCLLLLIVQLNSSLFSQPIMRVGGTLLASLIIWQCARKESNSLLGSPFLVFFGDISYSLYLIHWPLIVAAKYYLNVTQLGKKDVLVVLIASVVLSLLVHRYIETNIIQLPLAKSLWISLVLGLIMLGTIPIYTDSSINLRDMIYTPRHILNFTLEETNEAIQWNEKQSSLVFMSLPCIIDKETEEWTNMTREPELRCVDTSNGTANVLVIGNSIAYRAFPLIHSIFAGRYKSLRLYSKSNCPPLSNFCEYFTNATKIVVDRLKPDFLISAHSQGNRYFTSPLNNISTDRTFAHFQSNLDYYSKRSKVVIIDLPFYRPYRKVAWGLAKRLHLRLPLDDLVATKQQDEKQQKYHRARLEALKCANCLYNHVNKAIYEGDAIPLYNRSSLRAYTKDGLHFTPEGLQLIRPFYEKTIEKALEILKLV